MPANYKQNKLTKLRDLAAGLGVVASLAVEAIEEVAEAKADKLSAAAVTIPVTGWNSDSATGYPYYYSLSVSGVTAADRVDVLIAPASLGTAAQCGLCPVTETGAGYVRIRAVSVPSAAMSAEVQIMKGGI